MITDFGAAMKNYSKQREAIITVLRDMKTHPTATAVYEKVREIIPNISLGTVYRNLAALRESGDVLAISIGDGFDHFDGDKRPHIHLHCRECQEIKDLFLEEDPAWELASKQGFEPDTSVYIVCGICKDCISKKQNLNNN